MSQPRRRNKESKIAKILKTSNELFKKQGFNATTTNQIAAEANVSIGLIYKYFPGGKSDIALKLVENVKEGFMRTEIEKMTLENAPSTLNEVILRYIKGHRRVSHNVAAFEAAALIEAETSEIGKQIFSIGSESMQEMLVKLLGEGDNESIEMWGRVIFHILDSVVHRQVIYGELICTDEELADALTKIILSSLPYMQRNV